MSKGKGKPPAFQLYAADFLGDPKVSSMTLQERGAHITLLCCAWQEGAIPADPDRLAKLLHVTRDEIEAMWPALEACWSRDGSGLVNGPLEEYRAENTAYREKQRANSNARWRKERNDV